MRLPIILFAAAALTQTAWGFPPPTGFPPKPTSTASAHAGNPCGPSRSGPRADLGREVLVNRCDRIRAELQKSPDNADLQERCNRAAKALTGRACEAPTKKVSPS